MHSGICHDKCGRRRNELAPPTQGTDMSRYAAYADDYYVNLNLNTEMELPQTRETVLHFFEQLQKVCNRGFACKSVGPAKSF